MKLRIPVIGLTYSVVCPSCCSTVQFTCDNPGQYGVPCGACGERISLENPQSLLSPTDKGYFAKEDLNYNPNTVVCYAPEVEESNGLSAAEQVCILIKDIEYELRKEMPEQMTEETTQALVSKQVENFSKNFSFIFPIIWAIEFVLFGRRPYVTIGHVRLFRRYVPFKGYVYFPVPKTTTSAALPLLFFFVVLAYNFYFCALIDEEWLYKMRNSGFLAAGFFLAFFVRVMFADPGYIRPGYMDREKEGGLPGPIDFTGRKNELTLKEIESNKRESKWEMIHGVSMERKWCSTCEMYRPVRAAHCYHCGLCCYDHDHHCGVIGICVGRRNALVFTLFLIETCVLNLILVLSMANAFYWHTEKLSPTQLFFSCIIFLTLLMSFVSVSSVMLSMCYGFASASTTRERIQYVYASKKNPFDRGYWRNLMYHLWDRQPTPSLFDENFVKLYATLFGKRGLDDAKTSLL
ncbi:unnamed protein product [Phytomonas sp. Hart1]|nr:unnamed protein product [Phytomonas sp. Hart1]|eukprot:CCW68641.1 unnamed protein product [Phytomonas sp. isolate Hart1]